MAEHIARTSNFATHLALGLAGCMIAAAPLLHAQQSATHDLSATTKIPAFDVTSVKPNKTADRGVSLNYTPDGFQTRNAPMQFVIREAFGVNDDKIIGAPSWVQSAKYDIDAKVNGGDVETLHHLSQDQRRSMLQPILADRFKLTYHWETRSLPVYTLIVAKGGSKLQESKPAGDVQGPRQRMQYHDGVLNAEGMPVVALAQVLSQRLGRTIIDKSGLTGNYDFTLQWIGEGGEGPRKASDAGEPGGAFSAESGPSIFTALVEQLGLKLESEKGPVQVLVIDHIEMPAEN